MALYEVEVRSTQIYRGRLVVDAGSVSEARAQAEKELADRRVALWWKCTQVVDEVVEVVGDTEIDPPAAAASGGAQ